MIWIFVFGILSFPEPVPFPMEVYNKDSYSKKRQYQSQDLIVCSVHVGGYGSEASMYIDVFQSAAEYIAAFSNLRVDFGIMIEEGVEEAYVSIHVPNVPEGIIHFDQKEPPKFLTFSIIKKIYEIVKIHQRNTREKANPEVYEIKSKLLIVEKLIKTAVDKADARMNQAKKSELEKQLQEFIPEDKLRRTELRMKIRMESNATKKSILKEELHQLKMNKTEIPPTSFDNVVKAARSAFKELKHDVKKLNKDEEYKLLEEHRKLMAQYAEEDDEEDDGMMNIMKAASEAAETEKERKEYAQKAQAFQKIKDLKAKKKAERQMKKETDENDPISVADSSEDTVSDLDMDENEDSFAKMEQEL